MFDRPHTYLVTFCFSEGSQRVFLVFLNVSLCKTERIWARGVRLIRQSYLGSCSQQHKPSLKLRQDQLDYFRDLLDQDHWNHVLDLFHKDHLNHFLCLPGENHWNQLRDNPDQDPQNHVLNTLDEDRFNYVIDDLDDDDDISISSSVPSQCSLRY